MSLWLSVESFIKDTVEPTPCWIAHGLIHPEVTLAEYLPCKKIFMHPEFKDRFSMRNIVGVIPIQKPEYNN